MLVKSRFISQVFPARFNQSGRLSFTTLLKLGVVTLKDVAQFWLLAE